MTAEVSTGRLSARARATGLPCSTAADLTAAIFHDGFTTRADVTDISGRGVGLAALAGALYGHYQSYISPEHFQPLLTIYIFLAVTAGGVGRPVGAVFGAYAVISYIEATRFMAAMIPGISAVQSAAVREMLVAVALLLILCWKPTGVFPEKMKSSRP